MSYDVNTMPENAEQLEICVDHYFNQGTAEYEIMAAEARANAEAEYAKLPEDDKSSLDDYIAQAIGMIPPAKTREEWKQVFVAAGYGVQSDPMPEANTDELFAQLRSFREVKLRDYDAKISQLERRARLGENVASELAAWDAYALALCNLPDQEGAPWDGGGSATPWPAAPNQLI